MIGLHVSKFSGLFPKNGEQKRWGFPDFAVKLDYQLIANFGENPKSENAEFGNYKGVKFFTPAEVENSHFAMGDKTHPLTINILRVLLKFE